MKMIKKRMLYTSAVTIIVVFSTTFAILMFLERLDYRNYLQGEYSKNMYELIKTLKLNTSTVYEQYCPMKKAAWLSESEDIRNPYYGDDMLECGTVSATLKAVN